jgi:hypothetical protein
METHKSLAGACKAFFGFKPQQSLQEFMLEMKQLTDKDRQELTEEFAKIGITIDAAVK